MRNIVIILVSIVVMTAACFAQEEEIELTKVEENKIVSIMKKHVDKYIQFYGKGNILKRNEEIKWKFFDWFWCYNRKILRDYIQLTRKLELHELYKNETGKSCLFRGEITLLYIKWLYREKKQELLNFVKKLYPIF